MARSSTEPVEVHRAPLFEGVPHGFLGRRGGVSTGVLAGLNVGMGSDDAHALIARNRELASEAVLAGGRLVTVYQVHSAVCVTVGADPWPEGNRPQADALVTDQPGILLGILTADCAPVLFADREAGIVGAAHAGWKGAVAGVTDATIAAMEKLGARRSSIVAAVGPCIAQASYEVDQSFRDRFVDEDPLNADHFAAGRAGHHQFDLQGYVLARLNAAGLARAQGLGLDTYSAPQKFYSFRRATHRAESSYGRQISLIALP